MPRTSNAELAAKNAQLAQENADLAQERDLLRALIDGLPDKHFRQRPAEPGFDQQSGARADTWAQPVRTRCLAKATAIFSRGKPPTSIMRTNRR